MPGHAANLSLLFCEHPLAQRCAAATAAGFSRVEVQFPNPFKVLDAMGYSGVASLEYIPQQGTVGDLDWLEDLGTEKVEFSL
ncbi:MAG: hypothetical protein HWE39_05500 [Oceanospirillaceae bacterium]|nr:hypothetical protein [Oceanospirillaceae bacterium]